MNCQIMKTLPSRLCTRLDVSRHKLRQTINKVKMFGKSDNQLRIDCLPVSQNILTKKMPAGLLYLNRQLTTRQKNIEI